MAFGPEINELITLLQKERTHFDIPPEFGGEDNGKDRRFSSIYNVKNLFRVWANYVKRESFFNRYPQMTNHGIEHAENVVSIVAQMVLPFTYGECHGAGKPHPEKKIWLVNRSELFCLAAAAFLHDIGMYVTHDDLADDNPDIIRETHGKLSKDKMFRERDYLFPGFADAEVHLIGAIAAYHQSKAPFDQEAKDRLIARLAAEGKFLKVDPDIQEDILKRIVMLGTLMEAPMWKKLCPATKWPSTQVVTVTESGEVKFTDALDRTIVVVPLRKDLTEWPLWIEWLNQRRDLKQPEVSPTLRIIMLGTLMEAPMWKKLCPESKWPSTQIVTVTESGEVKFTDSHHRTLVVVPLREDLAEWPQWIRWLGQRRDIKQPGVSWTLWRLRHAPEGETVDPRFLAALLALADQCDNQVIRTGDLEFMVRQLDRARSRFLALSQDIDAVKNMKAGDLSVGYLQRKGDEAKYLDEGYIHFLPNLAIERVLLIPAKIRKDIGAKTERELGHIERKLSGEALPEAQRMALESRGTVLEKELQKLQVRELPLTDIRDPKKTFPEQTKDPLIHVILRPNDFDRLKRELKALQERGAYTSLVDQLEPYLRDYSPELLVGSAGAYIVGELDRLKDVLWKRDLSLAVYSFNQAVDERAFPEARKAFSSELAKAPDPEMIYHRELHWTYARKLAFEDAERGEGIGAQATSKLRCLWMYGPHGIGRSAAALEIAKILITGRAPKRIPAETAKEEIARIESFNGELKREFKQRSHQVMWFRLEDRGEDQLSHFIRALSWFLSVNGEFALENMLRQLEDITKYHADFAIECLQRVNQNLVICLLDANKITQVNRWFFQRLVNADNRRIRVLATTSHRPTDNWIAAGQANVEILRFSFKSPQTGYSDTELSEVWREAVRVLKSRLKSPIGQQELDELERKWRRFGCYPIFFHHVFKLVTSCHVDMNWLINRIDAYLVGHLLEGARLIEDPQKVFLDFLTHYVSDEKTFPTVGDVREAWQDEDCESHLRILEDRGLVDLDGDETNPGKRLVILHPAYVRSPIGRDKTTIWKKIVPRSSAIAPKKVYFLGGDALFGLGFRGKDINTIMVKVQCKVDEGTIKTNEEATSYALQAAKELGMTLVSPKPETGTGES